MRLRFSRQALIDLENIGDFIARDNPDRAVAFIAELRARRRLMLSAPDAAPARPELGAGVRVTVFGRYLILYDVGAETLEVRRIVHGARDFQGLFEP